MNRLDKNFYLQDTELVAKNLLGKYLYKKTEQGLLCGKIVETEAYLYENDPACHAHKGKTKRNETMFEEGGVSYVYFIYGNYFCFNVVSDKKGKGTAVLIRALEPVENINIMKTYRPVKKDKELTNGPSKLCIAFNINKTDSGKDLINSDDLFITQGETIKDTQIVYKPRIGISKGTDLLLRYYIKDNIFISKE